MKANLLIRAAVLGLALGASVLPALSLIHI